MTVRATSGDIARLMDAYPKIYFACHARHTRDPDGDQVLSAHQMSIMGHLDRIHGERVTDLAEHMGVTASTMSLHIKRLEHLGYVRRDGLATDGRVIEVRLTEAGTRIREAHHVLDTERVRELLQHLDPKARERGLAGLEALAIAGGAATRARSSRSAGGATRREALT